LQYGTSSAAAVAGQSAAAAAGWPFANAAVVLAFLSKNSATPSANVYPWLVHLSLRFASVYAEWGWEYGEDKRLTMGQLIY